jgi:hypothetical protein
MEECCEANVTRCEPLGAGSNCPANAPRLRCDDSNDCPGTQICCASPNGITTTDLARCVQAANCPAGNGSQVLCDPTAPDPCPQRAQVCSVMRGAIFPNRPFCHL